MIYQLWRTPDGEIKIINPRTQSGQDQARSMDGQGCEFVGTAESRLSSDELRDGIAKKYIGLGMEAVGWMNRLGGKIKEANALTVQMVQETKEKSRHDKRRSGSRFPGTDAGGADARE
ncbi:MAG: hypothetical protein LUE89_00050 [Clostridiales bacterium]|nr:hypothetical protein [Clostridiales bacterium]